MKKEEFQEMIGQIITDREYEIIETVYMYHPSFDPESGGDIRELVRLSDVFGMTIFCDMYPRAMKYKELKDQLHHAQAEVDRLKEEMVRNRATMGLDYSRMLDKLANPKVEEQKISPIIASNVVEFIVEYPDGFAPKDIKDIYSGISKTFGLRMKFKDSEEVVQ